MEKYDVKVRYIFEGTYTVVAEDREEAESMVAEDCGTACCFLSFIFDSIFTCIYSNQFQSVPKTVLMSLFHLAYFL